MHTRWTWSRHPERLGCNTLFFFLPPAAVKGLTGALGAGCEGGRRGEAACCNSDGACAGSNSYAALMAPTAITQREQPKPKKNLALAKDASKVVSRPCARRTPLTRPTSPDPHGSGPSSAKGAGIVRSASVVVTGSYSRCKRSFFEGPQGWDGQQQRQAGTSRASQGPQGDAYARLVCCVC